MNERYQARLGLQNIYDKVVQQKNEMDKKSDEIDKNMHILPREFEELANRLDKEYILLAQEIRKFEELANEFDIEELKGKFEKLASECEKQIRKQ